MKKIVLGVIAHVDAGKTTLSESILYTSGKIRQMGRVDNKDAYLDTDVMEKERGITIFSKQAVFALGDYEITFLDTPGHVDFSAEMERALQVLDYAVLVISGPDGVQGHTLTLFRLLKRYHIPTFLFINKMDQPGTDIDSIINQLQKKLNDNCIEFGIENEAFYEKIATCDEKALEEYLENERICDEYIQKMIRDRIIFPCYFGSALKLEGVAEFLEGIKKYMLVPDYGDTFGAKVYKIARDEQNNRLTYLKITGGYLEVKQLLSNDEKEKESWAEKVNQIRIYSGNRYESVQKAEAGTICAVTGLTKTYPGEGLGIEESSQLPLLEPVLTYGINLPADCTASQFLPKLRLLEEEEPELKIVWNEKIGEIQVQMMGEVQIEILTRLIWDRFKIAVTFDAGKIVYKETINSVVEGVGHFEPLRHYAEVHLKIEPLEAGSGIQTEALCSEDQLDKNWQRLILTHIEEREHPGVLTGSSLTDVKISLVAGKAHIKHTEGGDFRQATYRAIRQGLMKAESVLLEPYYEFEIELPTEYVGHAMNDIEKMNGKFDVPDAFGDKSRICGEAPVSTMRNYQQQLQSYTKGLGQIVTNLKGYYPCHNQQEILEEIKYEPEFDVENPTGSVFCSHGAGFIVPWYEVEQYMHLSLSESVEKEEEKQEWNYVVPKQNEEIFLAEEEVNQILSKTFDSNRRKEEKHPRKKVEQRIIRSGGKVQPKKSKERYLLVDGYNIVFAWKELADLAKENIDAARGKLMDILCNYQGYKKCNLILVFDAYKVKGNIGEMFDYHNIHVVYTKEAETADQYIEKLSHKMGKDYYVTVATSDGLEQLIIRGQGCNLISARELYAEVKETEEQIKRML